MRNSPASAADYSSQSIARIRATGRYVATALGDLMEHVVVVGGLVPSLIIDQHELPIGAPHHLGTMDLDLGFSLAILDHDRCATVDERLRRHKLLPDPRAVGLEAERRRCHNGPESSTMIDLLVERTSDADWEGQTLQLSPGLAAMVTPSLNVAFADCLSVTLSGEPGAEGCETNLVRVCGPGAFVVMKAIAFELRREDKGPKDAYDLYYVLRHYGAGITDVIDHFHAIGGFVDTARAKNILRNHFSEPDAAGPKAVARFFGSRRDDAIQADVAGLVRRLLGR